MIHESGAEFGPIVAKPADSRFRITAHMRGRKLGFIPLPRRSKDVPGVDPRIRCMG
jgi:hypothetical protein